MARETLTRAKKSDPMRTIAAILSDKENGHVVKQLRELLLNGDLNDKGDDATPMKRNEPAPKKKHPTQAQNHPRKGAILKQHPIRQKKDLSAIKRLLAGDARNYALFICGINTALRASDLTRLRVRDVRHLEVGEHFILREKKKKKLRNVTMNRPMREAIDALLEEMPNARDEDYLFASQKGGGPLTTSTLNNLVKEWCRLAKIRGGGQKFGSHSLRKTWGYHARVTFGMDLATLVDCFGHSTQKQTLQYLCVQDEEVKQAFMNEL